MEKIGCRSCDRGNTSITTVRLLQKSRPRKSIAFGERPVLHTVSDGYIQAALNDLSRACKADEVPKDYCAPDPFAKHILH